MSSFFNKWFFTQHFSHFRMFWHFHPVNHDLYCTMHDNKTLWAAHTSIWSIFRVRNTLSWYVFQKITFDFPVVFTHPCSTKTWFLYFNTINILVYKNLATQSEFWTQGPRPLSATMSTNPPVVAPQGGWRRPSGCAGIWAEHKRKGILRSQYLPAALQSERFTKLKATTLLEGFCKQIPS